MSVILLRTDLEHGFYVETMRADDYDGYECVKTVAVGSRGSLPLALFFDQRPDLRGAEAAHDAIVEKLKGVLALSIDEVHPPFSIRVSNVLRRANINTLGELACVPKSKILSQRNSGKTVLDSIEKMLSKHGLELAFEPRL